MTTTNGNKTIEEAATADGRAALIARRAYERWQARGCPEGDDRRDWFEAEQEVLTGASTVPSTPTKPTETSRSRNRG